MTGGTRDSDLADFLLARIAEDTATAKRAATTLVRSADSAWINIDTWGEQDWGEIGGNQLAHVNRWDPARVLAECAAKRNIVEHWRTWAQPEPDGPDKGRVRTDAWAEATRFEVLMDLYQLAQPYADHPDFREEWRL